METDMNMDMSFDMDIVNDMDIDVDMNMDKNMYKDMDTKQDCNWVSSLFLEAGQMLRLYSADVVMYWRINTANS